MAHRHYVREELIDPQCECEEVERTLARMKAEAGLDEPLIEEHVSAAVREAERVLKQARHEALIAIEIDRLREQLDRLEEG